MGKLGKSFLATMVAATVLVCLAGCSANPNPTSSATASASASDLPTREPMTPAEAKLAYQSIAQASCLAAQNTGVVEENVAVLKVMVAKAQAYKGYSAAYLEKPKTYGVIWEIDAFAACTDWYTFSMAKEAGQEAAIDVKFNRTDGSFTASQDLGQFGVSTWKYGVSGGLISSALDLTDATATEYKVSYGIPDTASLEVLQIAVDNYLASIK